MLEQAQNLAHLSTGDMFRAARTAGTRIGNLAKSYLAQGQLVPDELVWEICKEQLDLIGNDQFVLDGFPRTVRQAEWLEVHLDGLDGPPTVVISLEVEPNIIVGRLSERRIHRVTGESYHLTYNPPPADVDPQDIIQRKDDQPEAILNRLQVYEEQTQPVKAYYRALGKLIEIDGVGEIDEVQARITAALHPITKPATERVGSDL